MILNATVILSFLSMLGFFTAVVLLTVRSGRSRMGYDLKLPLVLALLIYAFIVTSNFLEHSGITDFFDPMEDVGEALFTLVLLFFVYNWRKQASFRIIRNHEIWLRSALASIADGVITTDRHGKILLMNPAMEGLTGWDFKTAVGQPADRVLQFLNKKNRQPLDYTPFLTRLEGRAGNLPPHGVLLRSRTGEERPVADSTSPILGPEGEILGLVGIFRDMTEYETLSAQVAHTHKMEAIGQLSGGVAHDLNNMIGGIMGAADVLGSRLKKEGETRHDKLVGIIRGAAENARALTADLLAFSRKDKLLSTPVSAAAVVDKTLALTRRTVDKRITLELKQGEGSAMVVGDPSQLQNALLNLILNACDAMPGGGTVTVSLGMAQLDNRFCTGSPFDISPGPHVAISVADTGTGIPADIRAKIFDPFFTTKAEGKGTGLGLSAVYQTAEKHRGAIDLDSTPGQGTTFTLYLPVAGETLVEPAEESAGNARCSGTILLIEDEDMVRSSIRMMLEDAGFHLLTAESGERGIETYKARQQEIDVVVLDMVMPGLTGLEVLDRLRQLDPRVRVLMTSGMSRIKDIPETAAGFIGKPFNQREAVAAIKTAMKQAPSIK